MIQSETNNNKQIKIVNANKLTGSCLVLVGSDMTEHFVSISQQTATVFCEMTPNIPYQCSRKGSDVMVQTFNLTLILVRIHEHIDKYWIAHFISNSS